MSPTEPGGKRIHLGNCKQKSYLPFLHGRAERGWGGYSQHLTQSLRGAPPPRPLPQRLQRGCFKTELKPPFPQAAHLFLHPPPPHPHSGMGKEQRWQSDRPRALLRNPGSLGLDSLDGPPALSLGHRTTLGRSHPSPTSRPRQTLSVPGQEHGPHKPHPTPPGASGGCCHPGSETTLPSSLHHLDVCFQNQGWFSRESQKFLHRLGMQALKRGFLGIHCGPRGLRDRMPTAWPLRN